MAIAPGWSIIGGMWTALVEIVILALAFALGVAMSSTVKEALGITREDANVEFGLLRADLAKLTHDFEDRLKRLEGKTPTASS
jgi:hypothetical protein